MDARRRDEVISTPAAAGASLGDPGPLGLAGFAATTFFLSAANANMVPPTVETGVLAFALFYGGIAQLLAGMWEFAKGNTFGALAFSSYGAFWLSFWYLLDHVVPGWLSSKTPPKVIDINHAIGLYLLIWTTFTGIMLIAASRVSGVLLALFAVLFLTFLALTIGKFADNSAGWMKLGGWLGLVTAVVAWYAALASLMNALAHRVMFPTFPR